MIRYLMMLAFLCTSLVLFASNHNPQSFLQSIKGSAKEGEQVYQHFCVSCHAEKPLIPVGAPKIQCEKEWKVRSQQGFETLLKHCQEGFNAMPARGGCFECSDEQLELAIKYLLPKDVLNELIRQKKKLK